MVVSAFLIGLAGSLHCVGMCSPLAIAVSNLSRSFLLNRFLYNGGRILTYAMLGAAVGAFGAIAGFTEFQGILSVGLGILLILFGIVGVSHLQVPVITPFFRRFAGWLKVLFGRQLQSKTKASLLLMGSINGLLPCGLTYFALTYCITLPNAYAGFAFMFAFGAGTLPAMLGLPALIQLFASRTKFRIQRLSAVVMIALGALLLARSVYVYQDKAHGAAQSSEVVCP